MEEQQDRYALPLMECRMDIWSYLLGVRVNPTRTRDDERLTNEYDLLVMAARDNTFETLAEQGVHPDKRDTHPDFGQLLRASFEGVLIEAASPRGWSSYVADGPLSSSEAHMLEVRFREEYAWAYPAPKVVKKSRKKRC